MRKIMLVLSFTALMCAVGGRDANNSFALNNNDSTKKSHFEEMKIWFNKPAQGRPETLPLGNGRLGALVYGGVQSERLQLSEETLWAGSPQSRDKVGAYKKFPELWKLLDEGKFTESDEFVSKEILCKYLSLRQEMMGELSIDFSNHDTYTNYHRELNFDSAVATVSYTCDGATFTRTTFVSAIDQALVMVLECDQPGKLTFDASFSRDHVIKAKKDFIVNSNSETEVLADKTIKNFNSETEVLAGSHDILILRGSGDPVESGLKFETRLKIQNDGGKVLGAGNKLHVESADRVTLFLTAATNFKKGTVKGEIPSSTCERQISKVLKRDYKTMLSDHIAEHQSWFRRATIELGTSSDEQRALPTDERIILHRKTGVRDADIEELIFQLGRYLLICSSRPGTQAATLHGIWPGTYSASGYNCAYHLDINIAENYWPAELTGLADCQLPLIDLVESLIPNAKKTAKDVFGSEGAVCALNVDAWLNTGHKGSIDYACQWVGGLGWITQHVWEHYAFSGDEVYLRDRAWPILKEVALFFLSYSRADASTEKFYIGPSGSPENGFLHDGKRKTADFGISMDQEIAHEIFRHCLLAAKDLGIDDEFTARVKERLGKLALPKIGKDGRLLEWREERKEADIKHRHLSHLYGFHPGNRITLDSDPQMIKAVRKSLEYRLTGGKPGFGPGGIVWQRGWLLSIWARFQEPENFYKTFKDYMQKTTEPNLCNKWMTRPYCMDGNGAVTAGIAEALLQSQNKVIHLLPCLPKEWASGSFDGLRARGGVTVSASWSPQKTMVTLTAERNSSHQVKCGSETKVVNLKAKTPMKIEFAGMR